MNAPIIVLDDPGNALNDPTIVQVMVVAVAVFAIAVILWKVATWLNRRGRVIPPIRPLDLHIKRIEQQAADRRAESDAHSHRQTDYPDDR